MTLMQSDLNTLKSLPCFTSIVEMSLLAEGMSHSCFKVTTPEQVLLAKKLNQETAITEVFSALACSKKGLSPKVVYHDNDWLVTVFIVGTSLAQSGLKSPKKISTALRLMAKLHRLELSQNNQSFPTLDTAKSINHLLTNLVSFNKHERLNLISLTKTLTNDINAQIALCDTSSVICHGDLNFTNILIESTITNKDGINHRQKPWLIDFECTHLAPVEFDLAMFVAVNNFTHQQLSEIVTSYSKLAPNYRVNYKLLTCYILYSYFINGLWYLDNVNHSKADADFRTLAIEQWSTFDSYAVKQSIALPKLLPIVK
jgi:thiamine kinase-like enzyme